MNMDFSFSGAIRGRRRWRTTVGLGLAAALVLGVPAAAYARTAKTLGFHISNDDLVIGVRVPASTDDDIEMPARRNGVFTSDVHGCPSGNAAYNTALLETLRGRPDEYVAIRIGRDYCALPLVVNGLDWDEGKYHFQVAPHYFPQPAGSGILRTTW